MYLLREDRQPLNHVIYVSRCRIDLKNILTNERRKYKRKSCAVGSFLEGTVTTIWAKKGGRGLGFDELLCWRHVGSYSCGMTD